MLHLVTGANGAGKTLNTLKWVAERAAKENRPVCHNGRFEPVQGGALASWKSIDFKDWQNQPDGTIFLIDECHNDMPTRAASSPVPDAIKALAEHRRRGMDFYLVTQHPQNVDTFVRRLIGSPGWHRHLKRAFGADLVSVLEWSAVNPNCEKAGAGNSGTVTMQAFPKEVYSWYKSASLHTGKKKIPKKLWVALACVILGPLALWWGVSNAYRSVVKPSGSELVAPGEVKDKPALVVERAAPVQGPVKTLTAFIEDNTPRIPGLPHTAPKYDEVTKPVRAPVPAACIEMASKGCKCYTQQGTIITGVSLDLCSNIVKTGFFMDFQPDGNRSVSDKQMGPVHEARSRSRVQDSGRVGGIGGRPDVDHVVDPVPGTEQEGITAGDIARLSTATTGRNIFARKETAPVDAPAADAVKPSGAQSRGNPRS